MSGMCGCLRRKGAWRFLGIKTTAESVETQEQLVLLTAKGSNEARGYLFGRLMPAADIESILAEKSPRVTAVA